MADHGQEEENRITVINHLTRAIGSLENVRQLVEDGCDCSDTLIKQVSMASSFATQLFQQVSATGIWGLRFIQEHTAPIIRISKEDLARYGAAYIGDTGRKVIYLTFDTGYENGFMEQILDVLKKHNVPAAFFLVGNYLRKNAELVRRMAAEGHIIGNHTMHHRDMRKLTQEEFCRELTDLEQIFKDVTGKELSKYYRPPEGTYSKENFTMAQKLGYRTVFWSLAHEDWDNDAQPTEENTFSNLSLRIHDGAVVLLHSTSETNARILDRLLTEWEDMGYTFESLDQLFAGSAR